MRLEYLISSEHYLWTVVVVLHRISAASICVVVCLSSACRAPRGDTRRSRALHSARQLTKPDLCHPAGAQNARERAVDTRQQGQLEVNRSQLEVNKEQYEFLRHYSFGGQC